MTPPSGDKNLGKKLLPDALDFLALLNELRLIRRTVLCKGSDIEENDMEHSYQLAMLCWFLISKAKLPLDTNKVIRYALAHDVLEVYSGDTPVFGVKSHMKETKMEREKKAVARLSKEWNKRFPEFIQAIKDYESRKDEESKFVYSIDKLIAPINIHLGDGRSWKQHKVTLDMMIIEKREKVKNHVFGSNLLEELVVVMSKNRHLFHEPK